MKEKEIIDWLNHYLQQNINSGDMQDYWQMMPDEMKSYVNANPEFKHELDTLRDLWAMTEDTPFMPNPNLPNRFDAIIESAQTVQSKHSFSWLSDFLNAWIAAPTAALSALLVVFALGYGSSYALRSNPEQNTSLIALQQQVSDLHATVALSMLQNASVSERLSGVAYSQQSDLSNPMLTQALLSLLSSDDSNAVKLEVIRVLQQRNTIQPIEPDLIDIALSEDNTLVQLALINLMANYGSAPSIQRLLDQLRLQEANPDVEVLIESLTTGSRA